MRKAPESVEMDNPLLAGRMSNKSSQPSNYRVPQDVILEKKHQAQMDDIQLNRPAQSDYVSKGKETKQKGHGKNSDQTKSGGHMNRDSSNE